MKKLILYPIIAIIVVVINSLPNKVVNFWERINGVNRPIDNTILTMLGTAQDRLAYITYTNHFDAGDTWSFMWCSRDDAGMKLDYTTKQISPDTEVSRQF